MNLQPQKKTTPEVNLTSLIDVVFLLLIFFMITTTFQQQSQLKLSLPETSDAETQAQQDVLELAINEQGHYFLQGREVVNTRPETLRNALKKAAGGDFEQALRIRADARAQHQSVVTAMDVAGKLGFSQLSIATTQTEQEN